jgi:hypothetical protein
VLPECEHVASSADSWVVTVFFVLCDAICPDSYGVENGCGDPELSNVASSMWVPETQDRKVERVKIWLGRPIETGETVIAFGSSFLVDG